MLKDLENRGFSEVAVCGGASIYTLFLEHNFVSEIYLTIEPILFGKGLKFLNQKMNLTLKLIEARKINDSGTLLLHYKVLK